ncbi:hypothetical protein HN604_03700, partial [archaeon]|nr:hypothetical protein [archaeon]
MKKKLARQDYGVTEATLAFLVVFLIVLSFVSFSNFNQQGIFDRKGFIDFLTGRQPPFTSPVDQIGLIAHWEFNEGAGTLVADSSSSGYDGAAVNIGWESSNCYEGACGSFSGVNGQVEIPSFNVAGNEISIAAWINPNSFAIGDARILSKAVGTSGNDHTFMLSTQNSGGTKLRFRLQTGGSTETHICTDQDLVTGTWQHVAAVYDGSSVVVYVNGIACILDSGGVQSGSITSADAPVWIGNNPPGTPDKTFDGFIDEIVIYDRGLTFAEIAVLADLVCGNGLLDAGETCDPPEAICSPEYGGSCDYCGNSCNYETVQGGFCGDLNVDSPDEVCDGGSQNCDAGAGAYGTQSCSNDCSAFNSCVATGGFCGDGTTDSGFGETCDDGNNLDGDGCDTLCQFESLSSGGGWTTFTPSVDTEIVYISDSLGNDAACEAYLASEISDPFNPTTSVIPCKTISQAKGIYDLLPDNEPHWLLFKAGDTWNGQSLGTWSKSGRSKTEPAVVASYDTTTINRP